MFRPSALACTILAAAAAAPHFAAARADPMMSSFAVNTRPVHFIVPSSGLRPTDDTQQSALPPLGPLGVTGVLPAYSADLAHILIDVPCEAVSRLIVLTNAGTSNDLVIGGIGEGVDVHTISNVDHFLTSTKDLVDSFVGRCGQANGVTVSVDAVASAEELRTVVNDHMATQNDDMDRTLIVYAPEYNRVADQHHKRLQKRSLNTNRTDIPFNKRAWFNKYYFFSTGIFEGIFASLIVAALVIFAVSWASSITTMTKFEKDGEGFLPSEK